MQTVFFGTPEFAVPSLRALLGEGFPVIAVVTQPDKATGRSRSRLEPPPIKVVAQEEGLDILQPETPATPEFIETVRKLSPDIGVVVAYGHILKQELLDIPRLGMINLHASLLPALRGAAPIQHAILEGYDETGVSVMQMEKGMDAGPVLMQVPTNVADDETAGELTVRLAEIGALSLVEALTLLGSRKAEPREQDHSKATYAPKITRETARIQWDRPASEVTRLIRAMDPVPGAWCELDGTPIKFFGARSLEQSADSKPGQAFVVDGHLSVTAADRMVRIADVQPSGRKRMAASSWLRGRPSDEPFQFG